MNSTSSAMSRLIPQKSNETNSIQNSLQGTNNSVGFASILGLSNRSKDITVSNNDKKQIPNKKKVSRLYQPKLKKEKRIPSTLLFQNVRTQLVPPTFPTDMVTEEAVECMLDANTKALDVRKVPQFIEYLHNEYFEKDQEPFQANSKSVNKMDPITHISQLDQARNKIINQSHDVRQVEIDNRLVDTAISGLVRGEFPKAKERRIKQTGVRYTSLPKLDDSHLEIKEKTVLGHKEIIREQAFSKQLQVLEQQKDHLQDKRQTLIDKKILRILPKNLREGTKYADIKDTRMGSKLGNKQTAVVQQNPTVLNEKDIQEILSDPKKRMKKLEDSIRQDKIDNEDRRPGNKRQSYSMPPAKIEMYSNFIKDRLGLKPRENPNDKRLNLYKKTPCTIRNCKISSQKNRQIIPSSQLKKKYSKLCFRL